MGKKSITERNGRKILQDNLGGKAYVARLQGYSWDEIGNRLGHDAESLRRIAERWAKNGRRNLPWPIARATAQRARGVREGQAWYEYMRLHDLTSKDAHKVFGVNVDRFRESVKSYASAHKLPYPPTRWSRAMRGYAMRAAGGEWQTIATALGYRWPQGCREAVKNMCSRTGHKWPIALITKSGDKE